ncbi:flagellar filament capping protein FliD [Ectopseudomonas hydrolytica]|uniref:Flagellar hook-associated protein 2 n=1 Tax=Ectopseudomonas mendocina (strain ymp) TaxID=399739 RepID=A4XW72_ECTM1|nr:flagellar filament capping protein FliD [Pseudomonas hydrolytica]MBF8162473.1 flagellar filament capping protein FliD [Pseudomonas mendocina]UTH33371.1 flagellar filament capping protein FliD [Pseudomonas hydrolytica]UZZ12643.1 flagellar filament capping protein FliD [Pseudomonas mendocina]
MVGITGIGSGVDIDSIVKVLVDSERAPKTAQLDRLEKTTVARISALGTLTGALNTFKTAIDSLNKASLFEARTASSSNTNVLKVTAATTAPAGNYSVQVQQLASSSKVGLQSVSGGGAATFNSGVMSISAGSTSFDVEITEGNNTLAGMRDAINEAGRSSGVSASIITDDSGSRLVLTSTKTGAGNDIQVSVTEDGVTSGSNALTSQAFTPAVDPDNANAFLPPSSTTGAAGVISKAQSAKLTIDGLQLVRDTNKIDDALEGVTLDLVAAQSSADRLEGKTINLTVGVDKAGVKSNLQKFVSAYNALITSTSQLTAVVPVDGSNPVTGPLLGDSSVRNVLSALRNEMVKMTGEGGVRALADLGITTEKDGKLTLNDSALTATLDNNFDQVAGYLTGGDGLMERLAKAVSGYVSTDGVLKQRTDALNGTKKNIDEQRKALDLRVEKIQTRLYAQYNAMDSLVGQLKRTSESLSGMLANLPGFVRKDSK